MKYAKGIKYSLSFVALLYILGICFVPFVKPLKYNWTAWLVFGIYLLNPCFFVGY